MSGLAGEVRGGARSVWATLTVRVAPELTCTCLLHERKRELLVIVKVIQDVVIRISKGSVGRGLESGHEDRLQDIINGEVVEVAQRLASFVDFSKVDVDGVLGVAVPFHHAGHFASEEDRLHALVLEGEDSKKSFLDLLRTQLLGDGVGVEDCDGVGELGPKSSKASIHRVFEQVTFMLVQGHPTPIMCSHFPHGNEHVITCVVRLLFAS